MNPSLSHDSDYEAAITSLQPGWLTGNGRYTLIQLLGQGGTAVVWLAEDEQLRERVALKFLRSEIALNAGALEDLKRETARARKLTHANIVRVYDFFKSEHEAFVAMEFVDGAHLGNLRLDQLNEVFAWKDLQPLVAQLCEALHYAHTEGIVHRNLKPANLMADRKGRLKLMDVGFATGARSDSVVYLSPAQLNGETPGVADDIYALGVVLYELLTGQPPFFEGDIPNQIRNRLPPPMTERLAERDIQNEIPVSVCALVMACLDKNPVQRPQSANAIAEWLNPPPQESATVPTASTAEEEAEPAADETSSVTASPVIGRSSEPPPFAPSQDRPLLETRNVDAWSRREWIRLGAVAFVLAIVGLGAGLFAWTRWQQRLKTQFAAETADDEQTIQIDATRPAESPTDPPTDQPQSQAVVQPAGVKHETTDLLISGTGFAVKNFSEGTRAFANRNYVWLQVPAKFRSWNFTQTSGGKQAQIRVRAKRSTTLFAATAAGQSGVNFSGWEADGSVFYYNDAKRSRMAVVRKRLEAGQELDVPQGNWAGVILLLPK